MNLFPKQFLLLLFSISGCLAMAQSAYPDTEIFLLDVKSKQGQLSFGRPENISSRTGYDNQPCFSNDGGSVYYSSVREDLQSDIWKYDLRTKNSSLPCRSPESEFSPHFAKDGSMTVVRIEMDSTQRIWQYKKNSCEAKLLFEKIDSIGYYCLFDKDAAAMFLITEPSSLFVQMPDGSNRIAAHKIGRCLKKIPGKNAFSFVEKIEPWLGVIKEFSFDTGKFNYIIQAPYNCEDYEWLADGTLLIGQAGNLLKFKPGQDKDWITVAELGNHIANITRICVSPDGKKIALAGTPNYGGKLVEVK